MPHLFNNTQNYSSTQNFQVRAGASSHQNTNQTSSELNSRIVSSLMPEAAARLNHQEECQLRAEVASSRNVRPIISTNDYHHDDYSKFIALFSNNAQLAASAEKLISLQQEIEDKIITCFLNHTDDLKKEIAQDNYNLGRIMSFIEDYTYNKDLSFNQKVSYYIQCDIKAKITLNTFFYYSLAKSCGGGATQEADFTSLLYTFQCNRDNRHNLCSTRLSAIALYLYNNADDYKKQTLIDFMRLSQNVITNDEANESCKIKLLLEVLCLIENDIDCKEKINNLALIFRDSPECMPDGPPRKIDDLRLIEKFRRKTLTTAQHNITPTTQPVISQPKLDIQKPLALTPKTIQKIPLQYNLSSYTADYTDGCMQLLSEKSQQAISIANCKQTNEDLSMRILNLLFEKHSEFVELSKGMSYVSSVYKRIITTLDSSNPLSSLYVLTSAEEIQSIFYDQLEGYVFPTKQALQEGSACIQEATNHQGNKDKYAKTDAIFSTKVFMYHCMNSKSETINPIATLAINLYKNTDNTKAKALIEFLNLATITHSMHANTNIKINLLIGVASLLENNIDCTENMKSLAKYMESFDQCPSELDEESNQRFIELFRTYKLTDYKYPLQSQESHSIVPAYEVEGASNISQTQSNPLEPKEKLVLPRDKILPHRILKVISNEETLQQVADDLEKATIAILYRKLPMLPFSDLTRDTLAEIEESRQLASVFNDVNDDDMQYPSKEIFQIKYFNKVLAPKCTSLGEEYIWYQNEAEFINLLFKYNLQKQHSKLHQIVSAISLEIYQEIHNKDITPLIDMLILAIELDSAKIAEQEQLNGLMQVANVICHKGNHRKEIAFIRKKLSEKINNIS